MCNKGISLISVIISIICIIILASIVIFTGLETPDNALFSDFAEEISNIRTSLATKRANNFMEYGDEDYGFREVELVGAPDNFVSFSKGSGNKIGHLVDLNLLDYNVRIRGKGTVDGTVTFKQDDVFVYDKNGAIYYVLGYNNEDKIYYNVITYENVGGED